MSLTGKSPQTAANPLRDFHASISPYCTEMGFAWVFMGFFVMNIIFFRKIKAKITFRAVYNNQPPTD